MNNKLTTTAHKQKTLSGDVVDEPVKSAHVASNSEVFRDIARLHLESGDNVADVTYGKGVFWQEVQGEYSLTATDINPQKSPTNESVDCRDLPYNAASFDAVVFDPPYSSGFFKENQKGSGSYQSYRDNYTSENVGWEDEQSHPQASDTRKRHARVLDLYYRGAEEAKRVLNKDGVFIVKCQDEVSDNKNYMTHVEVINFCEEIGFSVRDLFVVVQRSVTSPNSNQHVALKNHSYFIVFDVNGGSLRT